MNKFNVTDICNATAHSLSRGSQASSNAVEELTRAYQELAARNAKNLTASIQALSSIKSPTEFFTVQQAFLKDYIEASVSDSKHIAELTAAVFTAAFAPLKKQFETAQRS